ncbi:MAG: hypothetical protein JNK02_03305 [Planctomycetes bacterium]|nr:hypothetical protein [Planctomycetota bacterium]
MHVSLPGAAVLLLVLAACRTTSTISPPGLAEAVILRSQAARAWDVVAAAGVVGSIVRFDEPGGAGRAWFSVRNCFAQEVGIVDVEGRAWRYRPHQRDPEWLGTGTVLDGAARILGTGSDASLAEVPLDTVAERAAAPR